MRKIVFLVITLITVFIFLELIVDRNIPVYAGAFVRSQMSDSISPHKVLYTTTSPNMLVAKLFINTNVMSRTIWSRLGVSSIRTHRVHLPLIVKSISGSEQLPDTPFVVRFTYATDLDTAAEAQAKLDGLASWLDIWNVDPDTRTLTALVWPDEFRTLIVLGYQPQIDYITSLQPLAPPGYPCYRTVEELYATLAQTITNNYPNITRLVDYGDSWEKTMPGGHDGYDLHALEITNKTISEPKPVTVIDAGLHSRELAPPEVAMALIDFLTTNYNYDPDVTWLVDHHKIVILPMLNPDGRKQAELGMLWRKNTDNDDGCGVPARWGVDLNRNLDFKWNCCGGSSGDPCSVTYRGPAPLSEPEIDSYATYVRSLIPDQWNYTDTLTVSAPVTTTGTLINMHSADPSVLYPWGWTDTPAPNDVDLKAIADKYVTFNGYPVKRSLYRVDGTVRDWGYGDLGIPSFTLEMGTNYFQDCNDLSGIIDENLSALYYLIRISRTPYRLIHGPDVLSPTISPLVTVTTPSALLQATINDTQNGNVPIAAAVYYVDVPPWITTTVSISYPLEAMDGNFDEVVEEVRTEINVDNLSSGQHMVFFQGQDDNGNLGPYWATWLFVARGWIVGNVVDSKTGVPIQNAELTIINSSKTYSIQTNSTGYYGYEIYSDTYTITVTASEYYSLTIENVVANSNLTTTLPITLNSLSNPERLYLPLILKN